ncbi:hypothetical protein YSY22_22850 [Brevibacillus formosus]
MSVTIEALVYELLKETLNLKDTLNKNEVEPEELITILEKREVIMDKLTPVLPTLNDEQRKHLMQAEEVNSGLLSDLLAHQKRISSKLIEIKQLKAASNSYHYNNPTAEYGFFFDKKK